jgi:twitching motility protein PilT
MAVTDLELNSLLLRAVELGATDVHLKLGQLPALRRDGQLELLEGASPLLEADLESVLAAVTASVPSWRTEFEKTGELDAAYAPEDLPRFRVNGFRQRGATSFAFRTIPATVPTLAELGLPPGVAMLADEQRGLVLVTGATGSGKTTTLAAMIDRINRTRRLHVVTIEDPIEFLHPDHGCIVNQREVGIDTNSFEQALRRALRQDPDVLLIGELRDAETARTVLQAAESGHLVLTTMHTLDAAETLGRMVELFPEAEQGQVRSVLSGVLRGVISQRLLPRLGGGRVVAAEVMVVNARIAELVRTGKPEGIPEAMAEGEFWQMQTFAQALIQLVIAGAVDQETAGSAATNRHDFELQLDRALGREATGFADTLAERAHQEVELPPLRIVGQEDT